MHFVSRFLDVLQSSHVLFRQAAAHVSSPYRSMQYTCNDRVECCHKEVIIVNQPRSRPCTNTLFFEYSITQNGCISLRRSCSSQWRCPWKHTTKLFRSFVVKEGDRNFSPSFGFRFSAKRNYPSHAQSAENWVSRTMRLFDMLIDWSICELKGVGPKQQFALVGGRGAVYYPFRKGGKLVAKRVNSDEKNDLKKS